MNLKKMNQKQTSKIMDALANHPEKKLKKGEVNLEKITKMLTDRRFAKNNTSEDDKSDEE